MSIEVFNFIIYAIFCAIAITIGFVAGKKLFKNAFGILLFVLLLTCTIIVLVKISNAITDLIDNTYTRSEVVEEHEIISIEYKDNYAYVTYFDNDKIITERNDHVKLIKGTNKKSFIITKYNRWFLYWYGWDIYE